MPIPNMQSEVDAGRVRWPQDWKDAHTGNANTEGFIKKLATHLHATDPRWGLNGKRGNPNDISDDVLAFKGEGTAVDAVNGGAMEIIDVIGGAGGPSPQPVWNVGPGGPGDRGTWVDPRPGLVTCPDPTAHIPKPPKPPKAYPGDRVWDSLGETLVADLALKGQALDARSGMWWARTIWRVATEDMTIEQSAAQSRKEWRAVLGLPPL